MRLGLIIAAMLLFTSVFSQKVDRPLTEMIIVKSNVLNLLAKKPGLTVEKIFSPTMSAEVSFVQGEYDFFNGFNTYKGFLLRAKKYFSDIEIAETNGYAGAYIGNLKRTSQKDAWYSSTGWFSSPGHDYSANSIRLGASLGFSHIIKGRIIIDGMSSLGLGKYTKNYKQDIKSGLYIDMQIWLSVGYCF